MAKEKDYQALNSELDAVLSELQRPDVQVDEAVRLYEQGLKLIAQLEKHLAEADNKVEKLKLAAANLT